MNRTYPLSFGPKFPEILVKWIAPVMYGWFLGVADHQMTSPLACFALLSIIRVKFYFRFQISQISSQQLARRLILNFFHQSFLSRDAYDRALGRDAINGRSKLTSQRQFASVRGRAPCIASVIASSTVGGSLGPFDRDKARQKHYASAPLFTLNRVTEQSTSPFS